VIIDNVALAFSLELATCKRFLCQNKPTFALVLSGYSSNHCDGDSQGSIAPLAEFIENMFISALE
jgi:hypothetical protein